ncbi:MAG: hypothetical protein ABEH40_03825 [Haloferacaceae archaeon]
MTGTDPTTGATGDGGPAGLTPELAAGWSRLVLFVGMAGLAVGALADAAPVVWAGVGAVVVALCLTTVGKLRHYRGLPVSRRDRALLAASWVLVAVTVAALLADFAAARYGPGNGRFFAALAAAGFGFGLLHMAAQSKYLPANGDAPDR